MVGEKTRGGEGILIIICTFLSLNESQRIINDPDIRTGFGKEGLESGCVCNDFKSRILLGNQIRRDLSKKKRLFAVGRLAWSVETFRILIFCVLLIAMSWLSIVLTRDRGERTSVRS